MALVDDEEDVNQIIADELHEYEAKLAEVAQIHTPVYFQQRRDSARLCARVVLLFITCIRF